MCVESMSFASTALTYIALNTLEILQLVLTVLTYIAFDGMTQKPSVSAFQVFFRIENWLNIKKVMSKNVCRVYVLCINCIDIYSIKCIRNFMTSVDTINIHSIFMSRNVWMCFVLTVLT